MDVYCVVTTPQGVVARLTRTDCHMLDALCAALCDKDIARILGYTLKTVKNKNRRVYGKLGVQNRVEAIVFALPFGFGRGSNGYR